MTDSEDLEAALDHLYRSILIADFGELPKILAKTEHLTARLAPITDKALMQRLRAKAIRNGLCLQASARGIRAAQRRLGDVTNANTQLSTYTSRGRRSEIPTTPGMIAKRL